MAQSKDYPLLPTPVKFNPALHYTHLSPATLNSNQLVLFKLRPTATDVGCLYLLRAVVTYLLSHGHNIAIQSTDQCMDNIRVLARLSFGQASSLKHHLTRNSNVIREIQSVQTSLQFPIRRHHVRSHQNDTNVDLSDLPFPTRVNKMCDTSCTLAHDCMTCRPPTTQPVFPSTTTAYLLINGTPYSSKIDIDLRHSSQDRQLRIYITERENWAPSTFHLVHWPTIQFH